MSDPSPRFRHADVGNRLGLPAPHRAAVRGEHRDAGPIPVYLALDVTPADGGFNFRAPLGPGRGRRLIRQRVVAPFVHMFVVCAALVEDSNAPDADRPVAYVTERHGLN